MNTTQNSQMNSDKYDKLASNPSKSKDEAAVPDVKRDQLRQRVEARVQELETSLSSLKSQQGNDERCRALELQLSLARDCMVGGWDKVGEVESKKLSDWLENSGSLIEKTVPAGATVPGQVVNAIEEGRTTVESSRPATSKPYKMPQA